MVDGEKPFVQSTGKSMIQCQAMDPGGNGAVALGSGGGFDMDSSELGEPGAPLQAVVSLPSISVVMNHNKYFQLQTILLAICKRRERVKVALKLMLLLFLLLLWLRLIRHNLFIFERRIRQLNLQ